MTRKNTRGFTLVEILIVVIILGILAAIVIPQFTNASQDARLSSLQSLTQTLRSQIELFKLQHGDTLPNLIGGTPVATSTTTHWNDMTTVTTYPAVGGKSFGPYMQSPPVNPLNSLTNVVDAGLANNSAIKPPAAPSDCGWAYDYHTGTGTGRIWGTDATKTALLD